MAATLRLPATGRPLLAGLRPTEAYLDTLATAYDAGLRLLLIDHDPEVARAAINAAIEEDTLGHIPDLLPPDSLAGIGWVLTDAMYLKARWLLPFRPHRTEPGPFHTAAGERARVEFMNGEAVGYAQAAGWTAVELPCDGFRLTVLALLPDRDGAVLDPTVLDQVANALAPAYVAIALPKVDLRWRADVTPVLTELGWGRRSRPAPTSAGCRRPPPTLSVTFDRPYLLLVRDTATGEPLFAARVTDPSRGG